MQQSVSRIPLRQGEQEALLADDLPFCETVPILHPPPGTPLWRDLFGTPFLVMTAVETADDLILGDQGLFALKNYFFKET